MAAASLMMAAAPAAAFSCPDHGSRRAEVLGHFQAMARSKARFVVVIGTVTVSGPERKQGGLAILPLRVTGAQLGPSGFDTRVTYDFQRRVVCAQLPGDLGQDCQVGYSDRETDVLLFLRQDGGALVLDHLLCGGNTFAQIGADLRAAVEACHTRGICQ